MLVNIGIEKALEQISCICYLVMFNNIKIWALLDLINKINIMIPVFTNKLSFSIWKINIKT